MNSKIKKIKIFVVFVIVVLSSSPFSFIRAQKQIHNEYKQALQFIGTQQYDKAIQAFERIVQKEPTFYRVYIKLVIVYKEKNALDDARKYFEDLIVKNPANPYAYYGLGLVWKEKKDYDNAVKNMKKAIVLGFSQPEIFDDQIDVFQQSKRLDDAFIYIDDILKSNPHNAGAHYGQAYVYRLQNKWKKAIEEVDKAIELQPDMYQAYFLKGWIYSLRLSNYHEAMRVLETSLKLTGKINDFEYRAKILRVMGCAQYRLGNFSETFKLLNEAKCIFEDTGNKKWIETVYGDLGMSYFDIGDYNASRDYSNRAFTIAREINEKEDQARHLNNLAIVSDNIGRYPEALEYYEGALSIDKEIQNERGAGIRLGNISLVYCNIGEYVKALEYSSQALTLARKTGDRKSESVTLVNMGEIYSRLRNGPKALECYQDALKKSKEIGFRQIEANSIEMLGTYYSDANKFDKAREYFDQALALSHSTGDKKLEGNILNNLGKICFKQNKNEQAMDYYRQSLGIGEVLNEPNIIFTAKTGLAGIYQSRNKYAQAASYYRQAIEKFESVRDELQMEQYKLSYLESRITVYEQLIDLYGVRHRVDPGKGYDTISFQYAERAKAKILLDILSQGKIFNNLAEIPGDFRQQFLQNRKRLEDSHTDVSNELSKSEDKRDINLIRTRNGEIESLHKTEAQLLEGLRDKHPGYYRLTNPKILAPRDIQKDILQSNQVLVEYLITEEKVYAWIITKNSFDFKTLSLSRKTLESHLARISPIFIKEKTTAESAIDHRWANINSHALNKIYEDLLKAPADKYLKTGTELIIVPDGILYYFPFEMLVTGIKDGKARYLIEDHPVSYSSSSTLLNPDLKREGRAGNNLLAFGNPDFNAGPKKGFFDWIGSLDPMKIIFRGNRFESLPNAETEVRAIAGNFKNPSIFTGKDATEARFKKMAADFEIIHLATHYLVSDKQPMYSKIVLSQTGNDGEDGFLQTYEVYNLKLNADMVVLSGCSTGLGILSRAEGLIGMSRAFLNAGVPSMIVSLWPVEDASTASLMDYFYGYFRKGLTKTHALQQAKIAMIRSNDSKRDPFYWSPFVLIGDSR